MPVTLEFPQDIEETLRRECPNLDLEAKEACVVELFRQGRLSHFQLARVLGVDRFEADAVLKGHGVEEQALSATELENDRETLRKVLGEAAR